jgi:hypothetical protein
VKTLLTYEIKKVLSLQKSSRLFVAGPIHAARLAGKWWFHSHLPYWDTSELACSRRNFDFLSNINYLS